MVLVGSVTQRLTAIGDPKDGRTPKVREVLECQLDSFIHMFLDHLINVNNSLVKHSFQVVKSANQDRLENVISAFIGAIV